MKTPHVYTILIMPMVEISAYGFTSLDQNSFCHEAIHLCEIARGISSSPPLLLCGKSATRMRIINVLNHFMCKDVDKPGEHEIRLTNFYDRNYPISKGDFVFIFFSSHGDIQISSTDITGRLNFLSPSDYLDRLIAGEESKSFCPDTRYWWSDEVYTERPVKTNFKITQTQYQESLVLRTDGYPRITTTATSDTVKIPNYDYNYRDYVDLVGEITFPVRVGTYHKSANESSQFTYFHSYLDIDNGSITYFHLTPTTTQQVFGYLPPKMHVPLSCLYLHNQTNLFNSYDLGSILRNTNTNVFCFISACHSGGFTRIHPKITTSSTCAIWTSSDLTQLTAARPWSGCFMTSLLKKCIRDKLSYRKIKDILSRVIPNKSPWTQIPQFNTIGSSEFDSLFSHHPFFPINGNINP